MIKCEELLRLDVFKEIKLIAGQKGLYRIVTWPYAKHTKRISQWVHGGELLLVSGYEDGVDEDYLQSLLIESIQNNLSGVVIEGGANIKEVSPSIIALANENDMPLFWMPKTLHFVDVTKVISNLIVEEQLLGKRNNAFLEKIISSPPYAETQARIWADDYNIKVENEFTIALFSIIPPKDVSGESFQRNQAHDLLMESIHRTIGSLLGDFHITDISKISGNTITYLLSSETQERLNRAVDCFEKIQPILENSYENCTVCLSFGRDYHQLNLARDSYYDASKAMKLLKTGKHNKSMTRYCQLGSFQLLFEIADETEMIKFRDAMLGQIIEEDKKTNAQLFKTLEVFLMHNGNASKTAEELFIHRNTLQYRLDKIKNILQASLEDATVRRDLLNAFMILTLYPFAEDL